jgi:hypothetical protein
MKIENNIKFNYNKDKVWTFEKLNIEIKELIPKIIILEP